MLSSIKLDNFKCFQHLDLNCRPLNLLCGLNGMGKSSVIQALLVIRQSFETRELLDGRLVLGGERADLGTGADILFDDAERDVVGFALRDFDIENEWEMQFSYSATADQLSVSVEDQSSIEEYVPSQWQDAPPFGSHLIPFQSEQAA